MRRLAIAALALFSACSTDSPTAAVSNVAGSWSGALTNTVVGNGTLTLTIVQSGNSLSGTYATTFPTSINNNSGNLTGTINGTQITATLSSSVAALCPSNLAAVLSSTSISGTTTDHDCKGPASNTFTITKR